MIFFPFLLGLTLKLQVTSSLSNLRFENITKSVKSTFWHQKRLGSESHFDAIAYFTKSKVETVAK